MFWDGALPGRRVNLRGRHLLLLDAIACSIAFIGAMVLRFDTSTELTAYFAQYSWVLAVLLLLRLGTFMSFSLYQRVWRYASVDELVAVVTAVAVSSLFAYGFVVFIVMSRALTPTFPRSVAVIEISLVLILSGGWRFAARLGSLGRQGSRARGTERTLIVGTATTVRSVVRELRSQVASTFTPVGIIADDVNKGQRLLGLPILGRCDEFESIVKRHQVAAVLLAMPAARGSTLRRFVGIAETLGIRVLTIPSFTELIANNSARAPIREVQVEDLLRRAPARIDLERVRAFVDGKTVLITGAGGSIGSELVRHLATLSPRQLVLVGRGENSLFELTETLRDATKVATRPVVIDIRDRSGIFALFAQTRPDIVFHAAAHKHVPLMELYPQEAVTTNVLGTANVVEAAIASDVGSFVFISTDKAVNPTSVLGVTKRIGELMVTCLGRSTGKDLVCVRFGNVLSSRGSVIPLFRRQLTNGGPLTVTHADATRFFMTIPEAVQLVLQAAVMGRSGGMYVLDMGEPVHIAALAEDLITLSGFEPGADIEIKYVGLRPGEKIAEELYYASETPLPTEHEAIRRIELPPCDDFNPERVVNDLARVAQGGRRAEIVAALRHIIPEYRPLSASDETPPDRSAETPLRTSAWLPTRGQPD